MRAEYRMRHGMAVPRRGLVPIDANVRHNHLSTADKRFAIKAIGVFVLIMFAANWLGASLV